MISIPVAMLVCLFPWAFPVLPDPAPAGATALAPEPAPSPQQGMTVRRNIVYAQRDDAPDRRTSLDVYIPANADPGASMPILVNVHGGGWSIGDKRLVHHKPSWAARNGWVLVSVNYRFSPGVRHPEHARDVAAALAWVRDNAGDFQGDPNRIAIMGHSAGAHLAAIVASDEDLLGEVGMSPDQLAGVVLLDGAGYHLPRRMARLPDNQLGTMYRDAFGDAPDLWELASPTLQARPGDRLPPVFCVHAGRRLESRVEGRELVNAWTAADAEATLHNALRKDHGTVNRDLGLPDDPDSLAVEAFLVSVFQPQSPGADAARD